VRSAWEGLASGIKKLWAFFSPQRKGEWKKRKEKSQYSERLVGRESAGEVWYKFDNPSKEKGQG
jgi:hypothetical protein